MLHEWYVEKPMFNYQVGILSQSMEMREKSAQLAIDMDAMVQEEIEMSNVAAKNNIPAHGFGEKPF